MKLKFLLFASLSVMTAVQAQNPGKVSGRITEKSNNAPISYASVTIKDNGKVFSGINTDDNGDFTINNLALKSYTIEIQYIGLSFLLFGFYRGPVDRVQQKRKETYTMDIGSRYTLLDNKMNISLRFDDVFNTMRYAFEGIYPYPQTGQFLWESQTVYLGLTYNFGGAKIKNLERKQREDYNNKGGSGMI